MNRTEAASFIGTRLGGYLSVVNRAATDTPGNLQHIIDDSLRAIGIEEADLATIDLPTTTPDETFVVSGLHIQLLYRALKQINLDLATSFDVGVKAGNFSLNQVRKAAEKDLADAERLVLLRFGTVDILVEDTTPAVRTLKLGFLSPSRGVS